MSQTTHFAITMLWTTQMFYQKSSLLFLFSQKLLLERLNTTCFRLTGSDLNGEHGVCRDEKQLKSKQHIDSEGKSPSAGALLEFSPNLRNKNKHPLFPPPLMTGNCSNVKNCHPGQTIDERVERVSKRMLGKRKQVSERESGACDERRALWRCKTHAEMPRGVFSETFTDITPPIISLEQLIHHRATREQRAKGDVLMYSWLETLHPQTIFHLSMI